VPQRGRGLVASGFPLVQAVPDRQLPDRDDEFPPAARCLAAAAGPPGARAAVRHRPAVLSGEGKAPAGATLAGETVRPGCADRGRLRGGEALTAQIGEDAHGPRINVVRWVAVGVGSQPAEFLIGGRNGIPIG